MTSRVTPVDWEAVRRDYATGEYTQAELVRKYGSFSQQRLHQRIKKEGWTRDMTASIKATTRARLIAIASAEKKAARRAAAAEQAQVAMMAARGGRQVAVQAQINARIEETLGDDEDVDADVQAVMDAAEANAEIIIKHRSLAAEFRALVDRLRIELIEGSRGELVSELVEGMRSLKDSDGVANMDLVLMATRVEQVTSLNNRIKGLDKLSAAAQRIVMLERQAHNINDDPSPEKPMEKMTDEKLLETLARFGINAGLPEPQ